MHEGHYDNEALVIAQKITAYAQLIGLNVDWVQISEHPDNVVAIRICVLDPDERNIEIEDFVENGLDDSIATALKAGCDRAEMILGSFSTRN